MAEATFQVDADIAGGNGIIERVAGDDIFLRPDLRDTAGHWFYWHIRVRGGGGRRLRFHLTESHCLTVEGPAVSVDEGKTWAYLGPESIVDTENWVFEYEVPQGVDDVRLSMGMPYTQENLDRFLGRFEGHAYLRRSVLCQSRQGRDVEKIEIGRAGMQTRDHLILTARHHACEMMASYALQGFMEVLLTGNEVGRWFTEHVAVTVIPFVDKDGVEDGDQGKNRQPYDHNRDYTAPHVYTETAGIVKLVKSLPSDVRLSAIDLHCPLIRGDYNEFVYLVGLADAGMWDQQRIFSGCLERRTGNPIPHHASNDLPYGQGWNNNENYHEHLTVANFMTAEKNIQLATSIEIPYAVADGVQVNQDSAMRLGYGLADAVKDYLCQVAN